MRMGQMGMGGKCGLMVFFVVAGVFLWPSSFLCMFISFSTKIQDLLSGFVLFAPWRELF